MADNKDKKVSLQLTSSSHVNESRELNILENTDTLGLVPENNGIFSQK